MQFLSFLMVLMFLAACTDSTVTKTGLRQAQPTVDAGVANQVWQPQVVPLTETDHLDLGYFPWGGPALKGVEPGSYEFPVLMPQPLDFQLPAEGCGDFAWTKHPVPGDSHPGPWCVGGYSNVSGGQKILLVGRPGARVTAFLLAIARGTVQEVKHLSPEFEESLEAHHLPEQAMGVIKQWVKNPTEAVK